MPDTSEEKKIKRFKFLKTVYDVTNGDRYAGVSMFAVGDELGVDRMEASQIFNYLEGQRLVEEAGVGIASITHRGILEIEQAETTPQRPTEHFPANVINFHGDATGLALQVGNVNSTQTANITISTQDVQSLIPWLVKLKENIPNLGLTEENSRAMTRNVTTLVNETQETEPDKGVLKAAMGRVKGLLETVGGHMIAVELLNELPAITHYLHLH